MSFTSSFSFRETKTVSTMTVRKGLILSLCLASVVPYSQSFVPGIPTAVPARKTTKVLSKQHQNAMVLFMSSREQDPPTRTGQQRSRPGITAEQPRTDDEKEKKDASQRGGIDWKALLSNEIQTLPGGGRFKMPPLQVDDPNLLFYDIFLLLNLVVSISFWVVHRLQLDYITLAFDEGCLLSILWILSGLYHGAFLRSAMDGHQSQSTTTTSSPTASQRSVHTEIPKHEQEQRPEEGRSGGGPPAAGLLALNTYINTISLRLIVAFAVAVVQHRAVGDDPMELLIPYEVGFGLVLMSVWRTVHSAFTPRI